MQHAALLRTFCVTTQTEGTAQASVQLKHIPSICLLSQKCAFCKQNQGGKLVFYNKNGHLIDCPFYC